MSLLDWMRRRVVAESDQITQADGANVARVESAATIAGPGPACAAGMPDRDAPSGSAASVGDGKNKEPNMDTGAMEASTPTAAPATPSGHADSQNRAATLDELLADFGGDPGFVVECQKNNMSLIDAHRAYSARMRSARDQMAALGSAGIGAAPVAGRQSGGGTYEDAVRATAASRGVSVRDAYGIVNKERPDLRAEYVDRMRRSTR